MTENLNEILGLPVKVKDFTDKKARTAYPIKMSDFSFFIECFSMINGDDLWKNFVLEHNKEALTNLLSLTFKDEKIEDIMDNINAGNFKAIIQTIMKINGLNLSEGEEKNVKEV